MLTRGLASAEFEGHALLQGLIPPFAHREDRQVE
jgi:hypothetical protein